MGIPDTNERVTPAARLYLLVAFGWSWSVAAVCAVVRGFRSEVGHVVWGFLFMLGPMIGALVAAQRWPRGRRLAALGLRAPQGQALLWAWAVPALILLVATVSAALLPGVRLRWPSEGLIEQVALLGKPDQVEKIRTMPAMLLSVGLLVQTVTVGAVLNTPMLLSEELGWRGLLWSCWERLGFWRNALWTGLVWGLWHAPIIALGHNYPGMPVAGVFLMILFCVLLTPSLHAVRERGGTVWHAALFHGTVNGLATLGRLCLVAPDWRGTGIVGVTGLATLALSVVATAWVRARWLRRG